MKTDVEASEESPSRTIAGRYRLVERIAGGGMGDVWRGYDNLLGRQVAVKVMSPELGCQESFLARFRFEARATAGLAHPNIAAVYDYGEETASDEYPTLPFIVMEFIEGESLESILGRRGRIPAAMTMDIVGQAARGLQAAHDRGIVHRDVKPGNLLVRPDGLVKITDFGIAKAVSGSDLTQTNNLLGTPQFMSPEQLTGSPATAASDVYALGVVAYLCLSGRPPFDGGGPMAVAAAHVHKEVPALPAEVGGEARALVHAMLEKDPAQRPPSALAVASTALRIRSSASRTVSMARVVVPDPTIPETAVAHNGGAAAVGETSAQGETAGDGSTMVLHRTRTKVFPIAGSGDPHSPRRRTGWRRLALLLGDRRGRYGLLLGVVAIAVLWWAFTTNPAVAVVPGLTGAKLSTDSFLLNQLGFKMTTHTVDGPQAAGTVLTQSPRPGSTLHYGSTVTLTVASGFADVNSRSLLGSTAAQAVSMLTSEGLLPIVSTSSSSSTVGTVIAVSPAGRVPVGTRVSVTVALAPTATPPAPAGPPSHKVRH